MNKYFIYMHFFFIVFGNFHCILERSNDISFFVVYSSFSFPLRIFFSLWPRRFTNIFCKSKEDGLLCLDFVPESISHLPVSYRAVP